jgi:hypothetical protein
MKSARRTSRTSLEVLFAVLGSVCGTLIAETVQDSLEVNLAGAVIGAAIPPFVSVTGRYRRLRAAMAAVVAFIALGITYSGAQIVSAASGDPILPAFVERRTTTAVMPPATAVGKSTVAPTSTSAAAFDLTASAKNAKCVHRQAGTSGKDSVRISFQLQLTGTAPGGLPVLVPVTAVSNLGATSKFVVHMSEQQQTVATTVATPAQPNDFRHEVTIMADPENAVAEADETNNHVRAVITVVAKATTVVPQCVVS